MKNNVDSSNFGHSRGNWRMKIDAIASLPTDIIFSFQSYFFIMQVYAYLDIFDGLRWSPGNIEKAMWGEIKKAM